MILLIIFETKLSTINMRMLINEKYQVQQEEKGFKNYYFNNNNKKG